MPLWDAGQLAFAHATSTPYRDKRSHFSGQDQLEYAIAEGAGIGQQLAANQCMIRRNCQALAAIGQALQIGASIGVSLVWGALVNVLPAEGHVQLQLRGNILHNTGTLRVGVTSVADCNAAGACSAHDVSRSLYPGTSLELPMSVDADHSLQLRYRLIQIST